MPLLNVARALCKTPIGAVVSSLAVTVARRALLQNFFAWRHRRRQQRPAVQGGGGRGGDAATAHMSMAATLAAAERVRVRPRRRRLAILDAVVAVQLRTRAAAPAVHALSVTFDAICLAALVVPSALVPAPLGVLRGRGAIPISPLWGRYTHWLGRLAFLQRQRREQRRRRRRGRDVEALRFVDTIHAKVAAAAAQLDAQQSRKGGTAAGGLLPRRSWQVLLYPDRRMPGEGFAGGGGAVALSSGDMVVSERFARFCMLHGWEGGGMLAAAFAQQTARVFAGNEAGELLLRAVAVPTLERVISWRRLLGGLPEPGLASGAAANVSSASAAGQGSTGRVTGGDGSNADGIGHSRDVLDSVAIIAAVGVTHWLHEGIWGAFRSAQDAQAAGGATSILAAAGYRQDALPKLQQALTKAEGMRMAWGRKATLRWQRGFWRSAVLNDPALRRWRKEAVAAVALGNWLLRR